MKRLNRISMMLFGYAVIAQKKLSDGQTISQEKISVIRFADNAENLFCGKVGEEEMSAPVYTWVIVYEGGYTEEKTGTCPSDFADDIIDVPIAIIREGWEGR